MMRKMRASGKVLIPILIPQFLLNFLLPIHTRVASLNFYSNWQYGNLLLSSDFDKLERMDHT